MDIFPAIDIIEGACVRLTKGDYAKKKKYFDDPCEVALKWEEKGAKWLHVVDLDGAKEGRPSNLDKVLEIKRLTGLKIQYGGGIRDLSVIEKVLKAGLERVILGTKIIEDEDFLDEVTSMFKGKFIPSIDYGKDWEVFTRGWEKGSGVGVIELLEAFYEKGIEQAIVTDISRDGTLEGIDLVSVLKIIEKTQSGLILAGGITSIQDIEKLARVKGQRIKGVIIGKSLYEGKIDLTEAIALGDEYDK